MKYGVSAYLWTAPFRDKDVHLVGKVAAMGYDVLEVPVWEEGQFDVQRLARAAQQHGVECVIGADMNAEANLVHPDAAVRQAGLDRLKNCIHVGEQLGAQMVAGPFCVASFVDWWPDEVRKKQDWRYAVEGLRLAAQYAAERGIRLALEILNRYETPFCTRASEGVELCRAVGHAAFGLLLDTFHMNIEEKQLGEAIATVGDDLFCLHACENDRGAPGSGHIPWREVSTALQRSGYDGYMVIESFVQQPDFAQAAKVWHPCAPNMDRLAADGLAFLKGLMGEDQPAQQLLAQAHD